MKALILAAGKGSRISRYLKGKPKCTVDIGGITLIENTIIKLKEIGINDIGIIVGYNSLEIKRILKKYNLKFYYNHFYDVTNSSASAWFAREFIDDDIIIMNGDVYIESSLLKYIINEEKSPILFADESRKEDGDYKLFYENNLLKKYGKNFKLTL